MASKSAYCGLMSKGDGLYLYLIPETEGGKKLTFKDVDEYLNHMNVDYDKVAINAAITALKERTEIKLADTGLKYPEDEYCVVGISSDKLKAYAKFWPPADGGNELSIDDIVQKLKNSGVRFGFDMMEIQRHTLEKDYCIDLELAVAKMPREGKAAEIIYTFNIAPDRKPRINEDGSVDFHNLDNVNHVSKGDLLATLIPADDGTNGTDVCGGILKPQKVLHKQLKFSNKITQSEDKTQIFSDVDGHVTLVEDRVFVSDVMEIPADVGPSTGDISYEGNVLVKGNVVTGYTISAKGDIIVEGVVEGANLIADGQIILKRGIQGGSKGMLQAGSNITTKFIESAEVVSGGYVQTESIMHSRVTARGDVNVGGKKGFITGGYVHAGNCISAKLAGNNMETKTILEVGSDSAVVSRCRALEQEIPALQKEYEKLTTILTSFAKKIQMGEKLDERIILNVKTLKSQYNELAVNIEEKKQKLEALNAEIAANSANGCIKISDTIFPGCKVTIGSATTYIKSPTMHSRLVRDGADVRVAAL